MTTTDNLYDDETVLKIIENLNSNHSYQLAELVDMTFGPKPESELQRLSTAEITGLDARGLQLLCHYHRWESAEKNNRMFNEHTDVTTRVFIIPFSTKPNSKDELLSTIDRMIQEAETSYLKGFE